MTTPVRATTLAPASQVPTALALVTLVPTATTTLAVTLVWLVPVALLPPLLCTTKTRTSTTPQ
jgi:hypothetical protein